MAKRKYPRIEVYQRTYDLLRIEEVLDHRNIRDILAIIVEANISREAKAALQKRHITDIPEGATEDLRIIKPEEQELYTTKMPLHENLEAQAKIIRLYKEAMPIRQMDKQVGYTESAIRRFLNKKIKQGELIKRAPSA
jgi:hypothetical protein